MMKAMPANCYAKNSRVYTADGSKSVSYKEILSSNTIDRTFSEEEMKSIKLKSFGEYSIVGQSKQPFDLPPKLTVLLNMELTSLFLTWFMRYLCKILLEWCNT